MAILRALAAIAAIFLLGQSATSQVSAQPAVEVAAKGQWDPTATYAKDDIVTSRGSAWISLKPGNKNKVPGQTPLSATWWQVFARGFNPTGAWSNVIKYHPDDLVVRNGQTWRAKFTNINRQPAPNQFWELLVTKGAAGAQGLQGEQGPPGPNTGLSAGTVSAPAISFNGDANTGIYSPEPGKIAMVQDGVRFLHNIGTGTTGLGLSALAVNVGEGNTAIGASALGANEDGSNNTAIGRFALAANVSGDNNVAVGTQALSATVSGASNIAVGNHALQSNTTGLFNVAIGDETLLANTAGVANTAVGVSALDSTTGDFNVAIGYDALSSNTSGSNNIAIGPSAGVLASASATNNIHVASAGVSGDTSVTRIGTTGSQTRAFIAGIRGITTGSATGINVFIDANGQLGTTSSSRRYKTDIETMAEVSKILERLRPVTFRYKQAQDGGAHPLQYGLIAEEVADVFPDLAVFKDEQPETVKYHLLPSFLLAGYQAQQKTIEKQADELRQQKAINTSLEERLRRLEALLPQTKAAALQ
jgi:hypothetical protein